jgi:hypothetical protein
LLSRTTLVALRPKPPFAEWDPELNVHERVEEAHGGSCVGVGVNIQYGVGRGLDRGLKLGKRAQRKGGANHAKKVCHATLERVKENKEPGWSSKGWWEVLQLLYECNGLVSAILLGLQITV